MNWKISVYVLTFMIAICHPVFTQENTNEDIFEEKTLKPIKGFVEINSIKVPIFPKVKEVRGTIHSDGRIQLIYNTMYKKESQAKKHFAELAKFYESKTVFGTKISKMQKGPEYAYTFSKCDAEIEGGQDASLNIQIDIQGHGGGSYVMIDNYCQ